MKDLKKVKNWWYDVVDNYNAKRKALGFKTGWSYNVYLQPFKWAAIAMFGYIIAAWIAKTPVVGMRCLVQAVAGFIGYSTGLFIQWAYYTFKKIKKEEVI